MAVQVNVIHPEGSLVKQLEEVLSVHAYLFAGQLGGFSLVFSDDVPLETFGLDYVVEINRSHEEGQGFKNFMSGIIRRTRYAPQGADAELLEISGPGPNQFLARHIVAYAAASAQSSKTDEADDMMKAIVTQNTKDATRGLGDFFTVADNESAGPSITKAFAWRNVLEVVQDISQTSKEEGTQVFFDVQRTSVYGFQFRTFLGQIGADRSGGSEAASSKVFSKEFSNIANVSLDMDFNEEVNAVYAGGQGLESDRVIVEVTNDTRIQASSANRHEAFRQATQYKDDTTGGITTEGQERLARGRPRAVFEAEILDIPGSRYGTDWSFGDKIRAQYRGKSYVGMIYGVRLDLESEGAESIVGYVRAEDVL